MTPARFGPLTRYVLIGIALSCVFMLRGWQDWDAFHERRAVWAEATAQRGAEMLVAEIQESTRLANLLLNAFPNLGDELLRLDDQQTAQARLDLLLSEWFPDYRDYRFFPHAECGVHLSPTFVDLCDRRDQAVQLLVGDPDESMGFMLNLGDAVYGRYTLLIHQNPARIQALLRAFSLNGQSAELYRRGSTQAVGALALVDIPDTPWSLGVRTTTEVWDKQRAYIVKRVGSELLLVLVGTLIVMLLRRRADRMQVRGSELEAVNVRLHEQATHDALTGLFNRYAFNEHFQRLSRHGHRENKPFSLLVVDIDYFKQVNDSWGHEAGDQVLKRVAEAIALSARRPLDMAARLGGEEFAVLLEDVPPDSAWSFAELLRLRLVDMKLPHPSGRYVTISVGVASNGIGAETPALKDLLERADRALYEAKGAGRNQVIGEWEIEP